MNESLFKFQLRNSFTLKAASIDYVGMFNGLGTRLGFKGVYMILQGFVEIVKFILPYLPQGHKLQEITGKFNLEIKKALTPSLPL